MEPLLRDRAMELEADIRLGTELIEWEQDADGVTAHLKTRDGHSYAVRAVRRHGKPIRWRHQEPIHPWVAGEQ